MSINICRDNNDPFYRYKMPPIQSKIEGRGNGIKTVILNASDVARALNRPTAYIVKWFGFELGTQTTISEDKDRYLVNGSHDSAKLQDSLDGFISKFVLCGSCKNPETEIVITKEDDLVRDCKACGKRTPMDLRHKLSSFMLKNPPESMKSNKKKRAATASANVVGGGVSISDIAQGQTQADAGPADNNDEDDSDDDELMRKFNAAASKLEDVQINDDDWAVDMSEEAVRARAAKMEGKKASKYDEFGEWLYAIDKEELPSDVEIYKKAVELGIVESEKTVQVLAQCLFDEDVLEQIDEHLAFLKKMITNEDKEMAFLGGIERWLGLDKKDLLPLLPKILVKVYNEDLISEEVLLRFGTKVSKKYVPKDISKKVRRTAKPFITWLQSAESDDEDSDSDEE